MKEEVRTEDMLFMMKKIGLYLTTQMELNLRDRDISGVQVYFMVTS